MWIELHDAEVGNSHAGTWKNIDYDYQAEMIVQEASMTYADIVKFILKDEQGERAIWEKDGGNVTLTMRSPRFEGTWGLTPSGE